MTISLAAQALVAFMLAVVIGMAFGIWILRGNGKTYTPPVNLPIKEYIKVRYDFRDDAPEIMQMLKRKYKNKDSIRKAKNVVDHIYHMYENRCKKCIK